MVNLDNFVPLPLFGTTFECMKNAQLKRHQEVTFVRLSTLGQNSPIDVSFHLPKKFYSFDENSADKIPNKIKPKKNKGIKMSPPVL